MPRRTTRLPDPLVGLAPDLGRALGLRLDDRPQPPREALAALSVEHDRVQDRAEDIVLALVEGAVADPHRARPGVAGELVAGRLGQVAPSVDPVHDLQRPVLVRLEVGHELHELVRLPVEVEKVERLQGEGRVAHPGEAVVPIALAPGGLGERGRQRGDRGAGWHVGEALDRQRRALDRLAPAVVGHPGAGEPVAPEVRGRGEPGVRIVDVLGRRQLLGPRERAEDLLSLLERVPRPDPVALDPELHVGPQPDRLPGAGRVSGLPVVTGQGPFGRRAAVIEGRFADQLELDAALDAERHAHEQMLAVLVCRRPGVRRDPVLAAARAHGERVADQHPTRRRVPGGGEDVRARLVDARDVAR